MSAPDLSQFSMRDLFRLEADTQTGILVEGLLALERDPRAADQLEACMRAAHSLKGAARIVNLDAAVRLAHALEECFVAAQKGRLTLERAAVDLLLGSVDLLARIAKAPEGDPSSGEAASPPEVNTALTALEGLLEGRISAPTPPTPPAPGPPPQADDPTGERPPPPTAAPPPTPPTAPALTAGAREASDRMLRVTADHLNRVLALSGESLVNSRWLRPFGEALLRLKRRQEELGQSLDALREALAETPLGQQAQTALEAALGHALAGEQALSARLVELELFDRRSTQLAHRLYDEAVACRMRPFADGILGLPRLVRDLARSLGKAARLEVTGEETPVDRDILEKLEAPLNHLLRNAVDHGLESPAKRQAAGKPAEGLLRLTAAHRGGMLLVRLSDDGPGIDFAAVRQAARRKGLVNQETADHLTEAELLDFLFLPGFSLKEAVTEVSGRGVGLNVVQAMVKAVRGAVKVWAHPGHGTHFQLELPLTLSVVRVLLVEISGEKYALPLAAASLTRKVPREQIATLEGRQHFELDGRPVGLVAAHQVLALPEPSVAGAEVPVVVLGDAANRFGVVVDAFLGVRELVVQPLDPRLGRIPDVSAGAVLEDGAPVLVLDVEDLLRSVEKLVVEGRLTTVRPQAGAAAGRPRKRVLVVDDSLTVRELERKLLSSHGYEVEVAVNGMDGWNAARTLHFDLVVTDVDMPRLDGIELVSLIKKDPHTRQMPVMIVSYKDREEDRQRGLNAGADYYLTKSSFHDETLVQAVVDLIGEADA